MFQGLDDLSIVLNQEESTDILKLFNSAIGTLLNIASEEITDAIPAYQNDVIPKLNRIKDILSLKISRQE